MTLKAFLQNKLRLAVILILLGVVSAILVCVLAGQSRAVLQPPQSVVATESAPSALEPTKDEIAQHTVPPTDPKYIAIPSLNVDMARVVGLGLLNNNQIADPRNIHDVGWYRGSSKPGQTGAVFMYGHVSSWESHGVFYDLSKLRKGDIVTVTRGDGVRYTYHVESSKIYNADAVDMREVLTPIDAKKPGLNLMTCSGKLIHGTNDFSQRLVVFMSLKS